MLLAQKLLHLAENVRLPLNETNVIGVGEHDGPAVWNLSAEMLNLLLVIFMLGLDKFLRIFSLRLGQRFNPVQDFFLIETLAFGTCGAGRAVTGGEKRKRRR